MLTTSIGALILINFVSRYVGQKFEYEKVYWLFEVAHFLAGFFVAMFFYNFFHAKLSVVFLTGLVGIFWELWEIIIYRSQAVRKILLKFKIKQGPITLADTALDIFLDFAGAIVFILLHP